MPTKIADYSTVMQRLNDAEKSIGITKGYMLPVFEVLCKEVSDEVLSGEDFTTILAVTTARVEQAMEQLQQGQRYSERWKHLSTAKTYLLLHHKEFITAIFGDEKNPDCITAVQVVSTMLKRIK